MSEETSAELLIRLGMNGDRWAKEFTKMFVNGDIGDIDLDLMRAWFCSAIMAGYDRGWKDALLNDKEDTE